MKSLSVMPRVDATSPPTFTCAPLPNRMPFGFTRNTLPLADRLPRMLEGSGPSTRLSAAELLLGCTNRTASPAPMLKPCQLIATFWLDWLIVVVPAPPAMLALPAETVPPVGRAWIFEPNASITEIASAFRAKREFPATAVAPGADVLLLLISEAATKVPVLSFQIDR